MAAPDIPSVIAYALEHGLSEGHVLSCPGCTGTRALEMALHCLRFHWSEGGLHLEAQGGAFVAFADLDLTAFPFEETDAIHVFRTEAAFESFRDEGCCLEETDAAVSLYLDKAGGQLLVQPSTPGSAFSGELLRTLRGMLYRSSLAGGAAA